MNCQPKKWLWGLLPLALLGLGAWYFNTPTLETKLSNAAGAELKSSGVDWATVAMDGRDARIAGEAPDKDALSRATGIVAGIYGVRRVDASGVTIAASVAPDAASVAPDAATVNLDAPTVNKVAGNSPTPEITGTWPEGSATMLAVSIAGTTYEFGSDGALTSDGSGNWKLMRPAALADGEYDVDVKVTDGKKAEASDGSENEVIVDTTPPAEPTIAEATGDPAQPAITGTYDKAAASLAVTAAGATYLLGRDDALSADATDNDTGTWTLALPKKLEPGSYDVSVSTPDAYGNVSTASKAGFLVVAAPPQQPPAAPTVAKVDGFANTPTVTGTWPHGEGNTLAVELGGKTYKLDTDSELTSDNAGKWSLTPSTPLPDGSYGVVAIVTNAAGQSSENKPSGEVTVLTAAPAAPTVAKVDGFANTPTVTGTWARGEGNTLAVELAGKTYKLGTDNELTSDDAGKWSLTPSAPLPDGTHDVVATVTNAAGLSSRNTPSGEVTVLTAAPAEPAVAKVDGFANTPTVTGTWPRAEGNALAVELAGKTYKLGTDSELTSDSAGKWSLTPSAPLPDGTHDVVATVTNAAGLSSKNTPSGEVTVLTAAPAAPTVAKVDGFANSPTVTGTWPRAEGNALAVELAGKTYKLGTDSELTSDNAGKWLLTPSAPLPDGAYDVKAMVSNAAGLTSQDATGDELRVDTTPPAAPTVAKVSGGSARPTIIGTWAEGDATKLNVEVNKTSYTLAREGPLTGDGRGNWTLRLAEDLPDGTYDIVATATDEAGNSSSDTSTGEVVVDSSAPAAPTVNAQLTREPQPTVTGSWPSTDADALSVSVGPTTYKTGESKALTVDGDNWALAIDERLEDGVYDVAATATDGAGNSAADASKDELVVDTTPPAVPTVNPFKSASSPPLLSGTFPQADANSMIVTFEGETFTLGSSSELSSDGSGNWSVQTSGNYDPGKYDVKVVVADKANNSSSDTTVDEIEILAPLPPENAEPAPSADVVVACKKPLDEQMAMTTINFRTRHAEVPDSSAELIGKLADAIKQCPESKIEVGGHTDSRGPRSTNQLLSEQRANAVRNALVAKGVNAANIVAVGYGESQPIADNRTREGRAMNRRTVFKVQP